MPVPGWVGPTTGLVCGGRTWIVFDTYAEGGEETITVLELSPRGDLGAGTVAWSRRDLKPAGRRARPGRVLHVACDGARAAVAMQIWDIDAGHELALVEWDTGAAS